MLYTLKNDDLTVTVNDLGAELWSVTSNRHGTEYLWQGDPTFWKDRSPIMFPFCGRVQDGGYSYEGKTYPMGCHGFAAGEIFSVSRDRDSLRFTLRANDRTKEIYPFDFLLEVTYRLSGETLFLNLAVTNEGDKTLPFTLGAHPGFRVPPEEGSFEDWYLEFGQDCLPRQMEISEDGFRTGQEIEYLLRDGRILPLSHRLFDIDGIFLYGMAPSVTLCSKKSERFVRLKYPDMPYLGFWHCQGEAPFLCIEPWCAMPAVKGESEDLSEKDGLFRIRRGEKRDVTVEMIFG